MARSRSKTAEASETAVAEAPDVFDQQIAARAEEMQNRPEQAAQIVQSVAETMGMPSEEPVTAHIANPSSTRRESAAGNGYATGVKRKDFKPLADPFGGHTISLSEDPKGPQARLLRSKQHADMWIQFTENPGEEIRGQLKEAGFHWENRAVSDFAKGAWVIGMEPGNEWRNHAHAEEVFREIVNQIREANGMEPFVPGAAQGR